MGRETEPSFLHCSGGRASTRGVAVVAHLSVRKTSEAQFFLLSNVALDRAAWPAMDLATTHDPYVSWVSLQYSFRAQRMFWPETDSRQRRPSFSMRWLRRSARDSVSVYAWLWPDRSRRERKCIERKSGTADPARVVLGASFLGKEVNLSD